MTAPPNLAAHGLGPADWLSLAAAPTFAMMALVTSVADTGIPSMLCGSAVDASPLSGMALMYLLMTAFHLAPWLKLISSRRRPLPNLISPMAWRLGFGQQRWATEPNGGADE
jgi:hypothetical protein